MEEATRVAWQRRNQKMEEAAPAGTKGRTMQGRMVKVASAVTPTTLRHSESEILK